MKTIPIKRCIFRNKKTGEYKWLSLESLVGESRRYLCESNTDTVDPPSQKPSDVVPNPGSLVDYENALSRISESGYDIVTQQWVFAATLLLLLIDLKLFQTRMKSGYLR